MNQLKAVVAAVAGGKGQQLAVAAAEEMAARRARRERGGAGDGEQAQGLAERRQRGGSGGGAGEAGDGGGEAFQGVPRKRRPGGLAPALGQSLQPADAAGQQVVAGVGRHPGDQADAQPDDGARALVLVLQGAERVAGGPAVGRGEGEEGGGGARGGGLDAGHAAALDQDREPAGQAPTTPAVLGVGTGEAVHEGREGLSAPRAEDHVEGAMEARAEPDAAGRRPRARGGLGDQQLRCERWREGAVLGGRRQARHGAIGGARRVPVAGIEARRAPVVGGAPAAVQHRPHDRHGLAGAQAAGDEPRARQQVEDALDVGAVPGRERALRGEGALRLGGLGQPVCRPRADPAAFAPAFLR